MKRWNLLIATSLITLAGTTGAMAFDQAQVQAVRDGQDACLWCDLSGANLANVTLTGVDLTGADLTGADLSGAVLREADLTGADLTSAILAGADLSGAVFTGADLDQVDLSDVVFAGARIENANCDWATKFPEGSGLICMGVTVILE